MSEQTTTEPIKTPLSYRVRFLRHRVIPIGIWLLAVSSLILWSRGQVHYLDGVGIVETRQIAVSPMIDGTVRSLAADIFDTIQQGQIIVVMDDAIIGAELLVAEAEMAQLRSTVLAESSRLDTELAQLQADNLNDVRRFRMDEEEARLEYLDMVVRQESDTIKLERLRIEMGRHRDLVNQDIAAEEIYDDTRLRHEELKKELEEGEIALAAAKTLMDSAAQRRQELERDDPVTLDAADFLAPIRQALNVQEARIGEIKQRRAKLALIAPVSGQVVHIFHGPGETVLAGTPILAITGSGSRRVLAYVDERAAGQIQPGSEVRLQSQGRPEKIVVARVASAGSAVEELPLSLRKIPILPEWGFPVLIDDIPQDVFLPGERLSVRIKMSVAPEN